MRSDLFRPFPFFKKVGKSESPKNEEGGAGGEEREIGPAKLATWRALIRPTDGRTAPQAGHGRGLQGKDGFSRQCSRHPYVIA